MWTSLISAAVLGTCIIALFLLERAFPLRQAKRALAGRLTVNLTFGIIAFATVSLIVRPVAEATLGWTSTNEFGLIRLHMIPDALRPVAAFLLMDLTFYWWHRANHRLPLLWRLHNVHHFDPDLDLSTTFRFHFGELAFSSAFRMVQIGLIGPSLATYLVYEVIFQLGTLFHHSNLRLPVRVERILVRFLVTPRMHGIHHSQVKEETNANYSTVFSFWDRLHRTVRLNVPQEAIKIGVPGYAEPRDNRLGNSLLAPFRLQRDYWPREDDHGFTRTNATENLGQLAP
ncbi:MAG: sterol desaturase family protein [Desulfuromonadales bacterium]